MPIKENVDILRERVEYCRNKLKEIGIRSPMYYFVVKYSEYSKVDDNRIENLWYGKSTDETFTEKMEAFTKYKQTEFK